MGPNMDGWNDKCYVERADYVRHKKYLLHVGMSEAWDIGVLLKL